jgi:hypothetical protein
MGYGAGVDLGPGVAEKVGSGQAGGPHDNVVQ